MKRNSFLVTLVLFFAATLYGVQNDILTTYRTQGMQGIEKKLDLALSDVEYWDKVLQNKDTTFGYIERYDNILVCNKAKSKLFVYRKEPTHEGYKLVRQYNAFTGKLKGDKHKEGDLRTPIGIYEITKKIEKVDPFYGPLAFVTSYPNIYDKYQGKTGQGIWIHGLPLNQERDEFTKGCIAIDNKSIECLDKHLQIDKTILLIGADEIERNLPKKLFASILADLYKWRYAWRYNDLESYLSFYDESFRRFDGMDKEKFERYKKRIFSKKEHKQILFTNINILPYPNTSDLYTITFHEEYKSSSFRFSGEKTLVVRYNDTGMHIITER